MYIYIYTYVYIYIQMSFEVNLDVFKCRLSKNMCITHIFEHYISIIIYGIYACICIRLCRINVVPNVPLIMNVYIYIYVLHSYYNTYMCIYASNVYTPNVIQKPESRSFQAPGYRPVDLVQCSFGQELVAQNHQRISGHAQS